MGDKVFCPSCKETGTIIQGAHHFIINGKPVAYDGCLVACGCPSNRIIAMKSTMYLDELQNDNFSPVKFDTNESINAENKRITKIFWSFGEEQIVLSDISRHYVDINLHVQTENYSQGESVDVSVTYYDETNTQQTKHVSSIVDSNGLATSMNIFSDKKTLLINHNE